MSEHDPSSSPERRFLEEHSVSPDNMDLDWYYVEKLQSINDYQKTWMVRNFDANIGRVYDLYYLGRHIGIVDDEGNGWYRVYARSTGEEEPAALLDTQSLWEAVTFTEQWYGIAD